MRRDPRARLWDVVDASRSIDQFMSGMTVEAFTQDLLVRSAVERQFVIVGCVRKCNECWMR